MKVYDLSVPVRDGADWYRDGNTPAVSIQDDGSIQYEGWVSHTLRLQVLNGTSYIEASGHLFEDGQRLDQLPLERFIRRAHVVRLEANDGTLRAPVTELEGYQAGEDAVLVHCGWDTQLDTPGFYSGSPHFSSELQEWLLEREPALVAADVPSFDHPDDASMPFLRGYFKQGGLVVSPVVGAGSLPASPVTLCAAPLRLVGVNAAPCRVFAWTEV